jgi:hypothetical protein
MLLSSDEDKHDWRALLPGTQIGGAGQRDQGSVVGATLAAALLEAQSTVVKGARFEAVERQAAEEKESEEAHAVDQVLSWIAVNGWEGVQDRLFDMGETDYTHYSEIEPHMVAINADKGVYLLNGHQVRLIGADRYNPTVLLDADSKEVLWDIERNTKYTFPLARKYMVCKVERGAVHILLKSTGKAIASKLGTVGEDVQMHKALSSSGNHWSPPKPPTPPATHTLSPVAPNLSPRTVLNLSPRAALPSISPSLSPSRSLTLGPELGNSPGPVPQLASPAQAHDPPARAATALAMNPLREGTLLGSMLEENPQLVMRGVGRSHLGLNNTLASVEGRGEPQANGTAHVGSHVAGSPSSKLVMLNGRSSLASPRELEVGVNGPAVEAAAAAVSAGDGEAREEAGEEGMVEVQLSKKNTKTPCNPELWRALMTEGVMDEVRTGAGEETFSFRSRKLTLPVYGSDGLATVRDVHTGEVFYCGPGRHEVLLPRRVAADFDVVKQLMAWANVHGWHDLSRRLIEQGTTNYTKYAAIDQEMQPLAGGDANLFSYRGRTLRLVGPSRWDPKVLLDVESGEVLWDYSTATKQRFPWARQALEVHSDPTHIRVCDRSSGKVLVALELACTRDRPSGGVDQHAVPMPRLGGAQGRPGLDSPVKQGRPSPGSPVAQILLTKHAGPKGDMVDAILRLKEWVEHKGWFDLEARLLDAGSTDYRAYGEMERRMQPVAGYDNVFTLDGRSVQVIGHRLDPVRVIDYTSKEVLWDAETHTAYEHAWARQAFTVRTSSPGVMQVAERVSGALVVQINGGALGREGESDALVLQNILMNAVPVLQRPGLEALVQAGNDIVQVLKSFLPPTDGAMAVQTQAQLAIKTGDLLLVTHAGAKGWQLGRPIDLALADPLQSSAKEGWFPATYAAPVQELAVWRGRVIQIGAPETDGVVTVTDSTSGNILFWGHPEAPREEWNVANACVRAALALHKPEAAGSAGGGVGAGGSVSVPSDPQASVTTPDQRGRVGTGAGAGARVVHEEAGGIGSWGDSFGAERLSTLARRSEGPAAVGSPLMFGSPRFRMQVVLGLRVGACGCACLQLRVSWLFVATSSDILTPNPKPRPSNPEPRTPRRTGVGFDWARRCLAGESGVSRETRT